MGGRPNVLIQSVVVLHIQLVVWNSLNRGDVLRRACDFILAELQGFDVS